jgi:hypothetical protein
MARASSDRIPLTPVLITIVFAAGEIRTYGTVWDMRGKGPLFPRNGIFH